MENCNKFLMGLCVSLLFIVILINYKSKFGNISEILNSNYNSGCQRDNRQYPEGKVPASYMGLNQYEREGLLTKFVNNDPNKLT